MICEYIKLKSENRQHFGVSSKDIGLRATTTTSSYKATMIARNQEVCLIDGYLEGNNFNLNMNFASGQYQVKFFDSSTNVGTAIHLFSMVGKAIKQKTIEPLAAGVFQPQIFDSSGNQVGEFKQIYEKKEGFLQNYCYSKLILHGVELSVYIVGHGIKEIFFCMYDSQNNMVATVSKGMHVKHSKDRYTMYIIHDSWFELVAIATAIIHNLFYDEKKNEGMGTGSLSHALDTHQKELLEKYNPHFIPQIIQNENAIHLPENMPLVHQRVKESQNTFGIWKARIFMSIFLLCFAIIFLYLFLNNR